MGRLVRVNPRGVGGSSACREPGDYTFSRQLKDLEAVRRQLGVERWVFWGVSAGGCLGLLYALQHPQALGGLIVAVMGPSGRRIAEDDRSVLSPLYPPYRPELAALASSAAVRRPPVLGAIEPTLASAAWVRLRADQGGPEGEEEAWVLMQGDRAVAVDGGEERVWAAFEQFVTIFDVGDRLGEIRLPTLIGAGRQDALVPLAHLEALRAGIPHAAFVVLDETGHSLQYGTTDAVRWDAAVHGFLAAP
jgi:proline iminopeptidase